MNRFIYENQGTETMLVYHLRGDEHLDSFAKGMLQGNEMAGILRPSFIQKDLNQYLKFPVTSKIPLKDFLQKEMEKATVLKLCLSIASAVREVEEYMLTPEKLVLEQEYIFVDIRKKEAGVLYLPVDEFSQCITIKEFLLNLLSHTQYQLDQDVSYVAKLIHFLNQPQAWDFGQLQRYIHNLLSEQEPGPVLQPAPKQEEEAVVLQDILAGITDHRKPEMPPIPDQPVETIDIPIPGGFNPIAEDLDAPKKRGLFGKKEKKGKDLKQPGIPDMAIPGGGVPPKPTVNPPKPAVNPPKRQGQQPEVVLDVDEEGNFLAQQPSAEKKKKSGFFSIGKKKKTAMEPARNPIPLPAGQQMLQRPPVPETEPSLNQSKSTVYMGHGSSDEKNMTVIMGGGKDYGSTVILGTGGEKNVAAPNHVVKITRRRTGQGMVINKETFHIGSEGSFVDFYIGDNPAIGSCHADIFVEGGFYYITDRNSVNHTYVNGVMAPPMQAVQLGNGTLITLADEDFDFIIS